MLPTRDPLRDFRQTDDSMSCSAAFGRALGLVLLCALTTGPGVAQGEPGADEWTQEELRSQASGFLEIGVLAQARQIAALVRHADQARSALAQT